MSKDGKLVEPVKQQKSKEDITILIMRRQNGIQIFQALLTLALIGVTAIFAFNSNEIAKSQANISQIQTEILRLSSPPYEPELRIWFKYTPLLSTQNLLNERGQRERVKICIKNIGQTDTGSIYFHWQNNWTHNSNGVNILPGIESGKTNCTWIELTARGCWGDPDDCNSTLIPRGLTYLILHVECPYCIQEEKNTDLKVCVWENSSRECDEAFSN